MIKVEMLKDQSMNVRFTDDDLRTIQDIYDKTGFYPDDYVEAVLRVAFDSLNDG